jgi:Na+-driven multidrug efflux pump
VLELGVMGLRWLALGYLAFSVSQVLQGTMRGAGETALPMWISIISTVVIRMPLAYLIAAMTRTADWPNGQPVALFSSLLISWLSATLISIVAYRKGKWRRNIPESIRKTR